MWARCLLQLKKGVLEKIDTYIYIYIFIFEKNIIYIYIYPNKSIDWGVPKPCFSGKWWIIPFYEGNPINRSESTVTLFRQDPIYTLFACGKLAVDFWHVAFQVLESPLPRRQHEVQVPAIIYSLTVCNYKFPKHGQLGVRCSHVWLNTSCVIQHFVNLIS